MAKVKIENVTKKFGSTVAVNDVSLGVDDEEFLVLVGPSGCGKTTLLRMIAGLEEITSGKILINDKLVNNVPPKDRNIAMVFQNYALYPHMNVYDNMAFGLKLRHYKESEIKERVTWAAQILGINELLHRKPKELSGGQKQRVAVGRAIVRKPEVFLFDEPLSNLDAKLRIQMRAELSKLHQKLETTIIYVTHDQVEAMTMGSKIAVMNKGNLLQVGSPLEVYNRPENKFVASFIGSPSMNFMGGKISNNCFDCDSLSIELSKEIIDKMKVYNQKGVILGIRPEDIMVGQKVGGVNLSSPIKAVIEVEEPLGSETILNLSVGANTLVAKTSSSFKKELGKEITLFFNLSKLHFFDGETEKLVI